MKKGQKILLFTISFIDIVIFTLVFRELRRHIKEKMNIKEY